MERLATLLGDLEGGLLELDQLEESGDVGVTHNVVDVLGVEGVAEASMGWDALDLEHLADLQDALRHRL